MENSKRLKAELSGAEGLDEVQELVREVIDGHFGIEDEDEEY